MSWSLRRAGGVALTVAAFATLAFLQVARAQKLPAVEAAQPNVAQPPQPQPGQPGQPGDAIEQESNITLKRDNEKAAKIEAAQDYINTEDWKQATELLQLLLQLESDVFAQLPRKDAEGKVTKVWTSVRGEAKRLVATLPKAGLDFYKVTYGNDAALQLQKAKETGDPAPLADVMRRFLYTDAGGEATTLLATYYLDRGDFTAAALCFKRLIERDSLAKIDKNVLFKAAYAFHQIGDEKAENDVWKELATRGGSVSLGGRNHSLEELQKFVGGLVRVVGELNRTTWPIFGGNTSRNAKAEGDTAFMDAKWRQPLSAFDATKDRLKQATDQLTDKQIPMLSSFYPITATLTKDGEKIPAVVYRDYEGLHAYHLKTGKRLWKAPSPLALDGLLRSSVRIGFASSALDQYIGQKQRPTILFDNSTAGSLSSDNSHVFVVDDIAVPPPPTQQVGNPRPNPGGIGDEANIGNKLQAWSLATGKLRWVQGGRDEHSSAELRDSFFLGPPLPVAGRLYVLLEKNQDLKLAELDANTGKLLRLQPLAEAKIKLQQDLLRRLNASHLAAGEGMLICPTNAGAILCIDLLENSLVWAYPYGDARPSGPVQPGIGRPRPQPGIGIGPDGQPLRPLGADGWRGTAPIVQGGKVYFTAPDASAIHCVNLADGAKIWSQRRGEDDLYLAGVHDGKVIVVGRRGVRALDALKGTPAWDGRVLVTGQPSGMGVFSDHLYYLPLREGTESKEPEIVSIDLDKGAVHAHTKSRKKEVPGNLVFFEGEVISQSTSDIAVYPQLRVKLAQIDERIKANENDPVGLVERGELRLDKGDLQGAVEDLNRALQQPTIPAELVGKAKDKLFETLTDFLQRDFDLAEKYLDTYEKLCQVDIPADATAEVRRDKEAETKKRKTAFLCLVAKGREGQRKFVEAFEKYQQFAVFAGAEDRITAIDEPAVQAAPDVWVQGRVMALMQAADEAERKPLEAKVQAQWDGLKKTADVATIRRFVAVFGSHFPAGKEARLALAELLIKSREPDALLDAERHLLLLRTQAADDPATAGRAVECMARLLAERDLRDDAAYYYGILGRDFGDVTLADGRKGADVYNDLATNKYFLPQLDRVGKIALSRGWKVDDSDRNMNQRQGTTYAFARTGEPLPFFDRWQVTLRTDQNELRLEDKLGTADKTEVKKLGNIQQAYVQNIINQQQQLANQQRRYDRPALAVQGMGHLLVLQLGYMVYGIDPVSSRAQRVLWEKNLLTGAGIVAAAGGARPAFQPGNFSPGVDPDGTPTILFADGFVQRLGTPAALDSGVLCLQTRDTLLAIDPLTGRVLWTRSDVRSTARITCDAGHVFVVEMAPTGQPANTRIFRLADGVTVKKVPDYAAIYQKRVGGQNQAAQLNQSGQFGRFVLYTEPAPAGGQVARLYDPLAGKNVWEMAVPANGVILQSADPELFGVVEATGKLTVVNLKTRKTVLTSDRVTPADIERMVSLHLLSDGSDYFLVCNGPLAGPVAQFGNPPQPPLMLNQGMRALSANGQVYSFNGETGKIRWKYRAENQMLVLDRFDEMPVLLLASRYTGQQKGPPNQPRQILAVETVNKLNGKLIYRKTSDQTDEGNKNQPLPEGNTFHSLNLNPAEGKFEFVGFNLRITHQADPEAK